MANRPIKKAAHLSRLDGCTEAPHQRARMLT